MKTICVILFGCLIGFASIRASDHKGVSSVAASQTEETITIEEILNGIMESAMSYNRSLQNLTVNQTATLRSTLLGEVRIVNQIRFNRPNIIEQKVIEKEEHVRFGVNMKIEDSITYSLFTQPPISPLSTNDYEINLIAKDMVRERPVYLLKVKPKDKQGDFIDGKIWIDAKDFTVVRFEGKPLKKENTSDVSDGTQILEYDKIGDNYWLPILDRWEASWIMMIKLVKEVTYSHYEINTELDNR